MKISYTAMLLIFCISQLITPPKLAMSNRDVLWLHSLPSVTPPNRGLPYPSRPPPAVTPPGPGPPSPYRPPPNSSKPSPSGYIFATNMRPFLGAAAILGVLYLILCKYLPPLINSSYHRRRKCSSISLGNPLQRLLAKFHFIR
ncbi:hypothetical protein VNO78_21789 [Psophocarpus tetragonolobus]|uniref:Transmembrane protein n=1 Tax=Psophocarpus tetragonolobus TaxID=3891 RepID=A0AAN9SD90_PSOTE